MVFFETYVEENSIDSTLKLRFISVFYNKF